MFYSYHNESRPQVRETSRRMRSRPSLAPDEVACDIARSPMDFRFQEKSGHAADMLRGLELTCRASTRRAGCAMGCNQLMT